MQTVAIRRKPLFSDSWDQSDMDSEMVAIIWKPVNATSAQLFCSNHGDRIDRNDHLEISLKYGIFSFRIASWHKN